MIFVDRAFDVEKGYYLQINRAPMLEIMKYWVNHLGYILFNDGGDDEESNKRLKPLASILLPLLLIKLMKSKSFRDDIADDARKAKKAKLAVQVCDSRKKIRS